MPIPKMQMEIQFITGRIVDSIFDTYIQRGMKPLAQIGFMPEALSTNPEPYQHHWKPGDPYTDILQAGHIRQKIIKNGQNWFING